MKGLEPLWLPTGPWQQSVGELGMACHGSRAAAAPAGSTESFWGQLCPRQVSGKTTAAGCPVPGAWKLS